MKRIGILTMHRVINYGSALQAWATQELLIKLGSIPTIIDYKFPNKIHRKKRAFRLEFARFILHLFLGFPQHRKAFKFHKFQKKYFHLTKQYNTKEALMQDPPIFDIYLVGSDQVWNPKQNMNDTTFFLDFVPESRKKISFSSSLAQAEIAPKYSSLIKKYLSSFQGISVREKNGKDLLEKLLNKKVSISLDPTLMLTKDDYQKLACNSNLKINEPYILVYILQYAFNPYPFVTKVIQEVHNKLQYKVICLDYSAKQRLHIKNKTMLRDAVGPEDFLSLFINASFVITTSFHGTAFSLNFGIPFYSIINTNHDDDRMYSLLKQCNAEDRAITLNSKFSISDKFDYTKIRKKINILRDESIQYLSNKIK